MPGPNPILRLAIRSLLAATSRETASRQASRLLARYEALAAGLRDEEGALGVRVPPMPGVDGEMRGWSFFMLLEHNAIVDRNITATVRSLAAGKIPPTPSREEFRAGVLPRAAAGREAVADFSASVREHLATAGELGELRGTPASPHPLFGPFDAHRWHAMFAFHLRLHLRQAEWIARHLAAVRASERA